MGHGENRLKFEHLVEINDPANPGLVPLSRSQLWQGLVLRAEQPGLFLYGLDACSLDERGPDYLARTLHFGSRRVRDRVSFMPVESTLYEAAATAEYPASRLLIRIEEPAPGHLYLRFRYELEESPPADDTTAELRRQAYFAADMDTVSRLRQLAAGGGLH